MGEVYRARDRRLERTVAKLRIIGTRNAIPTSWLRSSARIAGSTRRYRRLGEGRTLRHPLERRYGSLDRLGDRTGGGGNRETR